MTSRSPEPHQDDHDFDHDHSHAHVSPADQGNLRRVLVALALTGSFMIIEVIGGLISGSLALLADAGHMLTDTMALGLAAIAFYVSKRPPTSKLTFGYQRFQILAAFVNGLSLLAIVGWIVFEAFRRLLQPAMIVGPTMLAVAVLGLLVNIAAFVVLHGGDQENLNIRGAALHVLGDLLGSVAAILAALVIIYTGWTPIDPLLSLLVALLILRSAWALIRRSAHVLLEGAPEWLDAEAMQENLIANIEGVGDIHHVHVWGLTPQQLMLTMHMRCSNASPNQTDLLRRVKRFLRDEYGIAHATIELEFDGCADMDGDQSSG